MSKKNSQSTGDARQLGFDFQDDPNAHVEPYDVPALKKHKAEAYVAHPKGQLLKPGDVVTLIHRLGHTKQVKFTQLIGPRAYVCWPVANESLAVSLKTGKVIVPRALAEWRLEPSALEMARVAHKMMALEQKIAVE